MVAIGTIVKIGGIIYKYAKGVGKFTSGETSIVSRFPPNYRPYIKEIIKGANIVTAGGIISDIIHDEWNGFSPQKQLPKRDTFSQKRSTRRGYNFGRSNRHYKYCKRRRQSSYY